MASTSRSLKFSQITKKRKAKSLIWDYFGLPANEEGIVMEENTSICIICTKVVASKGGTTSNMIGHLKVHHPSKYMEMKKATKKFVKLKHSSVIQYDGVDDPTYSNIKDDQCSAEPKNVNHSVQAKQKTLFDYQPLDSNSSKSINDDITKFLAFTMQPYNLVERKPFINMIRTLNPRYKLPSRKYFSKTGIPKLYNDTVEKMKQEIALLNCEDISITTDCWTSVANTPYIAVAVHFIDQQWNLKSICLNCAYFEDNHTYSNISNILTSILSDWGLDIAKVAGCTTDNGSNILKAMSHLKLRHITCFGHNINIGINRALDISRLERTVKKLKKLQSAISHSWKMKRDLATAQEFCKVDVVALCSACPTRWWSTLKLIQRFLSNQLPIRKMLQDYPDKKHLMLEGNEVSALEDFVSNTKLLEGITRTLSGEEYVTASAVLPLYGQIKKQLQCKETDNALSKEIKSRILSALSERYEDETLKTILGMASLCDPRFKLHYMDNADNIKMHALKEMSCIYATLDSCPENPDTIPDPPIRVGLEQYFDIEDTLMEINSCPEKKSEAELNEYLSMSRSKINANPLKWWQTHEDSFPVLKTLARKYLSIQGSSVSSERVFSTGGNIINRQRAALLPKNAEMLIFLAQNAKSP